MGKKTWDEFRSTGLLLFVNQFLHIFGWSLVVVYNKDKVIDCYPARTEWRGFKEEHTTEAYEKVTTYLKNNISSLHGDVFPQAAKEGEEKYCVNCGSRNYGSVGDSCVACETPLS